VRLGFATVPSDPPRIAHSDRGKKELVELLTKASEEQNPTKEKLRKEIKYGDSDILRVRCLTPDVGGRFEVSENESMTVLYFSFVERNSKTSLKPKKDLK
jgi:hypothetical protein